MDFYCFMQKKGTPAMNPKPGSQVKIGRKSKHPATETGVTEMQQTENQDETYPLTDTKQIPKHPATHGHKKKSVPQLAVCGTDIRVWRKERDSNPRYVKRTTVFETAPIDHSGIFPMVVLDSGYKISSFFLTYQIFMPPFLINFISAFQNCKII